MVVNTRIVRQLHEDFGEQAFLDLYNTFLEDVSEVVEGMRNSIMNKNIIAFQGWAHRGKTTAGTFGIMQLSKQLDYFAHCNPQEITLEKAQEMVEKCEKEFILAIDEINDYIRTMQK
ncbi:MAG: hypothetical protein ACP5PS_00040 [Bacteroidales bacterium]